ncbi:sugar ABC transporter permease [Pseudoclavibacter sp. RFBJ3]|uniref:carbohydrate ABC transporter permease n=1 Tax=unclassified Pseudoclavibacter TaxID=2615177 RepID=UPI000CE8C9B6|nr:MULTISPECIES: sugar ABC transporter permease [unclassified Pseudoclavibacter]MBF4549867.1 sugar ABC transporter permease [Pseudoclavibacter sp. VKM Ac-2888]PPF76276.1 sugar ABC transporter permease [Pseudoclavibacter sp. Z016]PPF83700.1 sugar ABC transporter permease [Pseudoclavibacter sp. RFBJ5]PPF91980.1 sugar ABC transporter permease [Pseudoclavibacter sp. RFBJ3]PPF96843.1 sugar ABC transporter permease [Pseudoclavibacter sp. RFBH5]
MSTTIEATTTEAIRTEEAAREGKKIRPRSSRRIDRVHYLFLVPTLVLFTIAITIPAVIGIFFSFTNSIGFGEWNFVGITNYIAMFGDPAIWQSYGFTMGFAAVTVILVNVLAFLLAIGLVARIRLKAPLRTVFVIPMVISGIVIAFVFNFLFSNAVPALGQSLNIPWLSESILANPNLAWIGIVIVTAWQAIPGTLLIYIAGLLAVPGDVYEAADLDGASKWQQMLQITLPLVAGYVVINVILGFKNFLNAYDIIVGLTDGGPGTSTRSIAMTIFTGFSGGDYAYQMANATFFFVLVVVISLLQLRLTQGKNQL